MASDIATVGHIESVSGQGPGHQFPRLQDIKVRIWGGGGPGLLGLRHYFRQVSTIFCSQNDNNDSRCYKRNDPSFMGHRHHGFLVGVFVRNIEYFCEVIFRYFSDMWRL